MSAANKCNMLNDKQTECMLPLQWIDGPSENYWQLLAETRRKALENSLVENEKLHERLRQLEDENGKYKNLLDEAQGIIDTLNVSFSALLIHLSIYDNWIHTLIHTYIK